MIIAAARRVAAREGIAEVSLSRVATEANFAPGVVYGHFRSKNELLLSVVANDLSAMAQEMRETGWPEDEDDSAAQAALPLEEPVAEQIPNAIAEVAAEPLVQPEDDIEPFAGNAGLTAVALALREPDEDAITSHETHEEIPAESEPAPVEEPVVEDHAEPVAEVHAEPIVEKVLESIAKVWVGPAVLPEDDMDPFGGDEMPAQISVAPVLAEEPVAEKEAEPVAETKFEPVLPEDDMNPFGDADAPAEISAEAVPVVEPIVEAEPAPVVEETAEDAAPVSDNSEIAEPVALETAPVEEEAVMLAADPVLDAIGEAGEGDKPSDLTIQNMPAVQKKRQERTQLNDIINRLVLPDASSSKGTSGAIARLDRRMSVFEKALADMEVRYGAIERDNSESVTAVAESVKVLTLRVEAGEKRALEITSELRGGILDAATRLAAVEAIMHSTTMGPGSTPTSRKETPLPSEPAASAISFTPTPITRAMPLSESKTNGNDFLAAARRSAAAAIPVEPVEEENTGSNRMRYLLGGGSVLVLVLAVAGYFASQHSSHVKHIPTVHVNHAVHATATAPKPVAQMPVAHAAQVPSAPVAQTPSVAAPVQAAPVASPAPAPIEAVKPSRKHKSRTVAAHTATHIAPVHVTAVHEAPVPSNSVQSAAAPLDRLTDLARAGNAKAETIVGLQYLDGDDASSKNAAAHWLHQAAAKGEPIAQYRLGTLYQRGLGVPADTIEAMHWYEAAAKQGNVKAMYNLGLAYVQTGSAPKDFAQAAHWFTLAADLGFVDAQFNLAVLYERGAGVPQSLVDAYKWYSIAGAAGDGVSRERISALGTQLNAGDLMLAQHAAEAFKPSSPDQSVNTAPTMSDLN